MSAFALTVAALARPAPARALDAQELVRALAASAQEAPDGAPLFPRDARVESARQDGERLVLHLGGAWGAASPEADELRLETLLGALSAAGLETGVELWVRAPDGAWRGLGGEDGPVLPRPPPVSLPPPVWSARPAVAGALAGRRIALSAGHGWLPDGRGGWRTQRDKWSFQGCGSCRGIVEDFFNAQVVAKHLLPLLQGMGAEVVLVRDPDHSAATAVFGDDAGAGYFEDGSFAAGPAGWRGSSRLGSGAASARFEVTAPTPGARRLALRWMPGADRTAGAVVEVRHAWGSTFFDLDQRRPGAFWLDLGRFWFGPEPATVLLTGTGAGLLSADAVKAGGGVHPDADKPWWQMSARDYVPSAGAPGAVASLNDVGIRPAYAELWAPEVYVSIHGNATGASGGSTATGTSSYRYSCRQYADHSTSAAATGCDTPPGSRRLLDEVHGALLRRLRAEWDPNWQDRGRRVANFGELRGLGSTPGILVEAGFFDNLQNPAGSPPPKYADNRSMHDPRWREALARGIAEGLAAWFGGAARLVPGRPEGLVVRNRPDGTLRLTWRPVQGAQAYRVQVIAQAGVDAGRDRAWDGGRVVRPTELVLGPELEAQGLYAFRVIAANEAGEGLPSQAVVARYRGVRNPAGPPSPALVIGAYDRLDAWVQEEDNDFAYAVEHGQALAAVADADVYFDGALDEAVEDGTVELFGYRFVDYAAGKDSREHESVSRRMQQVLSAYVAGGGALLLSGEEVGYDLVARASDAADRAFVEQTLGARYLADDADALRMRGAPGTVFEGLDAWLDDGFGGVFAVTYPDVYAPGPESQAVLQWPDGRAAAVLHGRTLLVGAPLEAVVPARSRAELFGRALQALAPGIGKGDLDLDGASDLCEARYGFDPRDGADGALDADSDGWSNARECRLGTDPHVAPSFFDAGAPEVDAGVPDSGADAGGDDLPDAGGFDAGAVDAGPPPAPEDDGCGCGGSAAGLPGLALAALLARRRTRARWLARA